LSYFEKFYFLIKKDRMNIEIVTKNDIIELKDQIIDEIKKMFSGPADQKEWLKSTDVMKILDCSPGTLQNLRVNGSLPYTKMGGTIYYSYTDVLKVLNRNKRNVA